MKLQGRRILIGVCGSIAAYKSAYLVRLLIQAGAEVRVVMTPSATRFVGSLTFRTLSGHAVYTNLWEDEDISDLRSPHIHLAEWAEIMLIAPATADTLSRLSAGRVENALDAVYLSARCPICIAPAMDAEMYLHAATQEHLRILTERGHTILQSPEGELASGLSGPGRMAEPEYLFDQISDALGVRSFWTGKKVLISAGPTYERIDPVRFIGNFATGKMGYAIAEAARNAGAEVTLVSGPSALSAPRGIRFTSVESAAEMYQAMMEPFSGMDIIIMSAAVADYRPEETAMEKIKKQDTEMHIQLVRTQDILAAMGKEKRGHQKLIGFALETQNEESNALNKMKRKHLDMIVLNSLRNTGAGFGHDTNVVTYLMQDGRKKESGLKSKTEIGVELLDIIESL
jgi:phosphopantothenoylcysteine decarboxylase / phosphopantothenate---cysteine ligase